MPGFLYKPTLKGKGKERLDPFILVIKNNKSSNFNMAFGTQFVLFNE